MNADDFTDERSPDPLLYATYREFEPQPSCEIEPPQWTLPRVSFDLETSLAMPAPYAGGYDYEFIGSVVSIVLLIEKSTMDDLLEPDLPPLRVDLIAGAGYTTSVTTAVNLLKRIRGQARPKVFHLRFRPGGQYDAGRLVTSSRVPAARG